MGQFLLPGEGIVQAHQARGEHCEECSDIKRVHEDRREDIPLGRGLSREDPGLEVAKRRDPEMNPIHDPDHRPPVERAALVGTVDEDLVKADKVANIDRAANEAEDGEEKMLAAGWSLISRAEYSTPARRQLQ